MSAWDWRTIESAARGHWITPPGRDAPPPAGCAIDSREVGPGRAFFALRGERTDGHRYLPQAAAAGAAMLVVEDEIEPPDPSAPVLRVRSVREALRGIASAYRGALASSGVRVIGVTGSNGKTTCVRLMHGALSAALTGTHSLKSHNNELGVPLTILNARTTDDYLICEVGTSAPGEIRSLSALVRPNIAVVTSVGRAHIEKLGSVAGVAREKLSMLDHVEVGGGKPAVAFVPDTPAEAVAELAELAEQGGGFGGGACLVRRVGCSAGADVLVAAEAAAGGVLVRLGDAVFEAPVPGAHNAVNAAMAVLVARAFGCGDGAIRRGLAAAEPPPMRLAVRDIPLAGGVCTLINDAYNANPESMAAAVRHLASFGPGRRRVAVIGEMLELGDAGPAAHRETGELIAETAAAELVVVVGELAAHASEPVEAAWGPGRVRAYGSADGRAAEAIAGLVEPGDVVLLKGSRATGLERVAEAIGRRAV